MQDFTDDPVPTQSPDENEASPMLVSNGHLDPALSLGPSQGKNRPNKLFAALLVGFALLIAGGGFLYVLLNPGSNIPSLIVHHVFNQPAPATGTPDAPGTANQRSASQDLASSQTNSTSTQQPTPSPTPSSSSPINAVKLSPQQLYTAIAGLAPVYSSGMSTQDSGQWDQRSGCSFADSAYAVTTPLLGSDSVCHSNALSVANFALQVSMTIRAGSNSDGGGLVFRDTGGASYRFSIGLDGSYDLSGTSINGTSSAIHTGLNRANVLTVIAQNNLIFLYVNGQSLAQITDTASSHGQIGLMATGSLLSAKVTFVNVKLWTL